MMQHERREPHPDQTRGVSIIRTKKSDKTPFVMLDTTAVNDVRLSFRAKGLHTYLMSKPDDWRVFIKQLEHCSPIEGREAIMGALKELEKAGYLHRERVRGEHGRLTGWMTRIYETPQLMPDVSRQDDDTAAVPGFLSSPKTGLPTSVPPKTGLPKSAQPKSANPQLLSIDLNSGLKVVKTPLPPQVGEQNNGTVGEHQAGTMADVTHRADVTQSPAAPLPGNSRAAGTAPRSRAARVSEAARHVREAHVAACRLCDAKGWLTLVDAHGTTWQHKCPHAEATILTYAQAHGYTWPHAPPPTTAGCESSGDDAGRVGHAKSPESVPAVASVQSVATKGRLPSAPAVDPGAGEGGPAP